MRAWLSFLLDEEIDLRNLGDVHFRRNMAVNFSRPIHPGPNYFLLRVGP